MAERRAKPLKRPTQPRARFTVQAIYDAFVRIWQHAGWDGLTTRAVALETGISVGTLYDYFPNKHALLSGYVRHVIEQRLAAIEAEAVAPADLAWPERIARLVRATCREDGMLYFDKGMLELEAQIAEPKHQQRFFDELSAAWRRALAACVDLPTQPGAAALDTLLLAVWGGLRYRLLLARTPLDDDAWLAEMERLCLRALTPPSP